MNFKKILDKLIFCNLIKKVFCKIKINKTKENKTKTKEIKNRFCDTNATQETQNPLLERVSYFKSGLDGTRTRDLCRDRAAF